MSLAHRLYAGEVSYDFIGRRKFWATGSGIVILVGLLSLFLRGFNLGIDFKGGDAFQFSAGTHSVADAQRVLANNGVSNSVVQAIGQNQIRVQTPPLPQNPGNDQVTKVATALAKEFNLPVDRLNPQSVGASWGSQITNKAIEGLVIFLIAVMGYISIRFTGKMAVAAMVALIHDVVITAGIYSLVGFEVTPSTVIALLTILGFSLYDTVVVFDKVRENTDSIGPRSTRTYTQAANLAVNQTLMRSINTSLIALLPVAALLFVGAGLLGAGTLKDLALAQFVGLAAGAYSSIFIATPLLALLKEREPEMGDLRKRVAFLRAKELKDSGAATRSRGGGRTATATATAVLDRPGAERPAGSSRAADQGVADQDMADPDRIDADRIDADPIDPAPPRVPGAPMVRHDPRGRRPKPGARNQRSSRRR